MLLDVIKANRITFMKNGLKATSSFLSLVIGEIEKNPSEILEDGTKLYSDDDVIKILKSLEKKTLEFINIQGIPDSKVESLKVELDIIQSYLPKQLTREELESMIRLYGTMPEYMKALKLNHNGQYDGKLASDIAKSYFTS